MGIKILLMHNNDWDFCCANPTCAFEATDNDAGEYTISAGGHKNRILLLYIEGIPLNFSYK